MPPAIIPITLTGDNLGERHKFLNNLVNEAHEKNIEFESIRYLHESSGIDRLFKIHLANKYQHLEYILCTLQDEDMLYVSKALKCLWLINDSKFSYIINPIYLENQLFPKMLTTASNKMTHWVQLNLKDCNRCQEFYDYYKKNNLDIALKFLPNCSVDYILSEMKIIPLNKITAHLLKLFCEKTTKAATVYFKELIKDEQEVNEKFITSVNFLLKIDPDIFFFMIEKYFQDDFNRLNKELTKTIMRNHRHRFEAKPELYAARILDLSILAGHLNNEQIKHLVTKLARANYLGDYWNRVFNYKFIEPLLKNINPKEKSAFCKKIFEEKAFGGKLTTASYPIPKKPIVKDYSEVTMDASSWMLDPDKDYDILLRDPFLRKLLTGGGGVIRTSLDELFDKYRFCSFEHTFMELQKRIAKESQIDTRRNIFIVLVSKTGGRQNSVATLLRFLVEHHINESPTLRAAVVRSLVKRAFVWRLPADTWKLLLQFGHNIGLDGKTSETNCIEGLHCVVLRSMLLENSCSSCIWNAFLLSFSPLKEYRLTVTESQKVFENLSMRLLEAAVAEPPNAIARLSQLCDTLDAYDMCLELYPKALITIKTIANLNPKAAQPLLIRLLERRTVCKYFIKEYFVINQTNASYCNALRHDANLLKSGKAFKSLLMKCSILNHDMFLRKLAVYFGEEGGLAQKYSNILICRASLKPEVRLARPMAMLAGANILFWPFLPVPEDEYQRSDHFRMVKTLWANAHLARPKLCFEECWAEVRISALAVWVHTCSPLALKNKLHRLLENNRHARLILALRVPKEPHLLVQVLPSASTARRLRALQIVLRILRHNKFDKTLDRDWAVIQSLINRVDLSGKTFKIYCELAKLNNIPKTIRVEYSVALYSALARVGFGSPKGPSYRIGFALMTCISDHLNQVGDHTLQAILNKFLDKNITREVLREMVFEWDPCLSQRQIHAIYCPGQMQRCLDPDYYNYVYIHLKLLAHYLLKSDSELTQILRTQEILKPYLKITKEMWKDTSIQVFFREFLSLIKCADLFLKETDYCLPILKTVQAFCNDLYGEESFSNSKMSIHFTIIFQRAAKQCVKIRPDLYRGGRVVKKKESDDLINFVFGLMLAEDVERIISQYFTSIRAIYCDCLIYYLKKNIERSILVESATLVANGLVDDHSRVNAVVVGVMLYKELIWPEKHNGDLQKTLFNSLLNIQVSEVKFFVHSIRHK